MGQNVKKILPWRSKEYRSFVRSKPCLACGKPSIAHHEPLGETGWGTKAPDIYCLPLCPLCHIKRHNQGVKTFWDKLNVEPWREMLRLLNEFLVERRL